MRFKFERRVLRDGKRYVAAFRPDDPHSSLNAAKRAINTDDYSEIEKVAKEQPLTFVGWCTRPAGDGSVVLINDRGEDDGHMLPGDHMLGFDHPSDVQATIEFYNTLRETQRNK